MKKPEIPWSIPAQFGMRGAPPRTVGDLVIKEIIPDFAKKEDLSDFVTEADISGFVTSADISGLNKIGTGEAYGKYSMIVGKDNITYTDNSVAEGESTQAGTRSFRIVSGDIVASTWTLKTTEGI